MKKTALKLLFIFCFSVPAWCYGYDDTLFIKVHFLYGSKPAKGYRNSENPWFGGILGGHVGIELDSNKVIDFAPEGKAHIFARRKKKKGAFYLKNTREFWEIFGMDESEMKKLTIVIPITVAQKQKLDSISQVYWGQVPYDYAFFGMRCASAAHDLLEHIGIVKDYPRFRTCTRIFYPKRLRKPMIRLAEKNHWTIYRQEGCISRKWEND